MRRPEEVAGGLDQLGLYALALRELGELPEDGCWASYCYLGGDEPLVTSRWYGAADLDLQRALLDATLESLAREEFERACGLRGCEVCGARSQAST